MESEPKTMNTKELSQAVSLLVEREETRLAQERRERTAQRRKRREEMEARNVKLAHSIEVIKWCIVFITTIMAVFVIIVAVVVIEVEREVERVKGTVQEIQTEAELIRDKIRHPLETIGGTLGRKLESDIGDFIGSGDEKQ